MEQWHCNNKNLQYLIPILFDLNTSAFREANSATKPLGNYRKVILLIMRNKGFDNESRYWCLATTHLNLKSNPIQFNHRKLEGKYTQSFRFEIRISIFGQQSHLSPEPCFDKVGNMSKIQVQSHQTALPPLPKQHVWFHNQLCRRKPWLLVSQLSEVCRFCYLKNRKTI